MRHLALKHGAHVFARYIEKYGVRFFLKICLFNCALMPQINGQNTAQFPYVDFHDSMDIASIYYKDCMQNGKGYSLCLPEQGSAYLLSFFESLYKANSSLTVKYNTTSKIPKIIHQIWIGPKEFPQKYKTLATSWLKHHPDWKYMLWDNESIKQLKLVNQDLFDAADNWGEKSDIARYEILYRFGGLYVDVDFECLKPFDVLHHCYDFYCGLSPLDCGVLCAVNALIGTVAGHPILKHCVESLKNDQNIGYLKTGPVHFTKSIYHQAQSPNSFINIVLPPDYFYPLTLRQKKYNKNKITKVISQKTEAFAIHYWAGSWQEEGK